MIKSIVYKSSTGHTKQYAEMLGEALKIPVYNLKEAKSKLKKKLNENKNFWFFLYFVLTYSVFYVRIRPR